MHQLHVAFKKTYLATYKAKTVISRLENQIESQQREISRLSKEAKVYIVTRKLGSVLNYPDGSSYVAFV